jgi:hypothetical protein
MIPTCHAAVCCRGWCNEIAWIPRTKSTSSDATSWYCTRTVSRGSKRYGRRPKRPNSTAEYSPPPRGAHNESENDLAPVLAATLLTCPRHRAGQQGRLERSEWRVATGAERRGLLVGSSRRRVPPSVCASSRFLPRVAAWTEMLYLLAWFVGACVLSRQLVVRAPVLLWAVGTSHGRTGGQPLASCIE